MRCTRCGRFVKTSGHHCIRLKRKPFSFKGHHINPIVNGRKFCARCGRYRLIVDFPAHVREPKLRLASYCHACLRQMEHEKRLDPKRGADVREYQRIWAEGKRRERGVPPRRWINPPPVPQEPLGKRAPRLPVEPLLKELRIRVNGDDEAWRRLARYSEMDERRLFALRHGEQQMISLRVADRLATAINVPLALIYPEAP